MAESFGLSQAASPLDGLLAGDFPLMTRAITVQAGQGILPRGTVMGKISRKVGTVIPGESNVGNGDAGGVAMGPKSKIGNYVATCKTASPGGGVFGVVDPDGMVLSDAEAGAAYLNGSIGFLISAGTVDFSAGDTFSIPIESPDSEEWVKSAASAVDGSQEIDCILAETVDATGEAVLKSGYVSGEFDEGRLTFGSGHSADSLRDAARAKGIHFQKSTKFPTY